MALVRLPYAYIPNPSTDRSVFNGRIWIGQPDSTDPENNQKEVILVQENGDRVTAQQPISTGAGGVPVLVSGGNASPVALDVEGTYSIQILDNSGVQIYFSPNSGAVVDNSQTDLRSFAIDLGLPVSAIGNTIAKSNAGQSLNGSLYLFDSAIGVGYELPSGIPPGSTVVSVTGTTLIASTGQFTMIANPEYRLSAFVIGAQDAAGQSFDGNSETHITLNYNQATRKVDAAVAVSSTSQRGVVQLNDSVLSASTTEAATARAAMTAFIGQTSHGLIGTYMLAFANTVADIPFGTTVSGGIIVPSNVVPQTSGSVVGTWRCMGHIVGSAGSGLAQARVSLFLRVL